MTLSTLHMAQGVGITQRLVVPHGLSIEEIVQRSHSCVEGVVAYIRAPIGAAVEWIEVPREMWRRIKPRVADALLIGYRMGDFLKSVFAIAAAVLISVAVPFLTPFIGATWAAVGAAAIGIGASLAINALFPSQQQQLSYSTAASTPQEKARQFANVESGNNLLAKEAYLPIVVGTRRLSPPEVAQPHLFLDQGTQTIQRVFALDGHHQITDVQVDRAPVGDFASITTEIRGGQEAESVATFIKKVTKTTAIGEALSTYSLDGTSLVNQEDPASSEPLPVRFVTVADDRMEEISIRLQIDSFIKSDSPTSGVRVPIRLRFRQKGSEGAWFNAPEIHLVGRDVSTNLKEIRLRWDNSFGEDGPGGSIQYEFYQQVPAADFTLSDGSSGVQWQAHSHFVAGAGLRDTQNIQGRRNSIRITLDPEVFPKAEYEWELIRGLAVFRSSMDSATYEQEGRVYPFFVAYGSGAVWRVATDQGAYVGRVSVSQATVIVDRQPVQRPKTALLALRAVGQSVRNVTVLASRYVQDWDGTGWSTLTTTSNPATHYRQVLHDYLVYHGISTDLIVNEQFVGWRQECEDRGYEVSAVFAGSSVKETLEGIATAGYARPRFSDGFGIDWFRDRSAERPVQTFSPRNASIDLEWVMGEKPVGIRASFQNADRDFADDEIQINNPFYSNFVGYDVRSYATIAKPHLVRRRATFDILQSYYQGRRALIVGCSIEGLICDRGDLVGVVTDLMDDAHSGARIRKVIDSTTFTYDQAIPTESTASLYDVPDLFDPANIFTVGEQSVVLISTPTGTEMRTVVAAEETPDGWTIRVEAPLPSTDLAGGHFVVGPVSRFMTRCIVSEVRRQGEERAQLVLVDEAPEIFQTMQERFGP